MRTKLESKKEITTTSNKSISNSLIRSKTPQANLINKKSFLCYDQSKLRNKISSSSKQKEIKSSSTNKINQNLFLEKANKTILSRNNDKQSTLVNTSTTANKISIKKSLTLSDRKQSINLKSVGNMIKPLTQKVNLNKK